MKHKGSRSDVEEKERECNKNMHYERTGRLKNKLTDTNNTEKRHNYILRSTLISTLKPNFEQYLTRCSGIN